MPQHFFCPLIILGSPRAVNTAEFSIIDYNQEGGRFALDNLR
jgi:hypothetical protein